jgi:molybdopterin molybdotransferase
VINAAFTMIPIAEARKFLISSCRSLAPARVMVCNASHHVLAETVRADQPVPPFDNSAMDGYAVRALDTLGRPSRLRAIGSVAAGDHTRTAISEGESVRIMTGAQLPPGADAVCPLESVRLEAGGSVIAIEEPTEQGTFVRRAGDDIRAGEEVFSAGTLLTPAHIGVLSSLGTESVLVHPRPRVGVLSTGDELVTTAGPLAPGKIRDANRPALLAQLAADRANVIYLGTVDDDPGVLASVLEEASAGCDAVLTSGGVSVGDHDIVKLVLAELSGDTMRWMQVAIKPAKPLAFGVLQSSGIPVFGLPGNPVSALVSYELFVRPSLQLMAGHRILDRPRFRAVADVDLARPRDGKLHVMRVTAHVGEDGLLRVTRSGVQGSHLLRAMAESNALALVPDGKGIPSGEHVDVMLTDPDLLSESPVASW